jgi:hypothetical protein
MVRKSLKATVTVCSLTILVLAIQGTAAGQGLRQPSAKQPSSTPSTATQPASTKPQGPPSTNSAGKQGNPPGGQLGAKIGGGGGYTQSGGGGANYQVNFYSPKSPSFPGGGFGKRPGNPAQWKTVYQSNPRIVHNPNGSMSLQTQISNPQGGSDLTLPLYYSQLPVYDGQARNGFPKASNWYVIAQGQIVPIDIETGKPLSSIPAPPMEVKGRPQDMGGGVRD